MFSIIKASDITAWFLGRSGRVMTKATLSSLFYLSKRRSLLERGLPLTGGTLVSLPEGTAVLEIKELLESTKPPLAWLTRIGNLPDGRLKLDLRRQPPALPGSDTRILEKAIEELGSLPLPFFGSPAQIRAYYPEWIEPDGADPVPITAEALFAAHGKPFDRSRFPRG